MVRSKRPVPERASPEALPPESVPPESVPPADGAEGISEITILPDGRVFVLGLSADVYAVLQDAGPWRGLSAARGRRVRTARRSATAGEHRTCPAAGAQHPAGETGSTSLNEESA